MAARSDSKSIKSSLDNTAQQYAEWLEVSEDQLLRMVCGGWDTLPANRNLPALKTFSVHLSVSIQYLNNCMGSNAKKLGHLGFTNWMKLYALTNDERILQWHHAHMQHWIHLTTLGGSHGSTT